MLAKAALASCHQHCRTAILMLLSGLDAWHARELLTKHHDHLRLALREAQRSAVTLAICRSAQCELSACTSTRKLLYTRPSRMASPVVSILTICLWAN